MARDAKRNMDVGFVLDECWEIKKILGEGAFGAVYEVTDLTMSGKVFALKVESNASPGPEDPPKMLQVTVLRSLRDSGRKFYPGYESCGQNDRFNYVVVGLVGKNVNDVRKKYAAEKILTSKLSSHCNRKFTRNRKIHEAGFCIEI